MNGAYRLDSAGITVTGTPHVAATGSASLSRLASSTSFSRRREVPDDARFPRRPEPLTGLSALRDGPSGSGVGGQDGLLDPGGGADQQFFAVFGSDQLQAGG